MIRALEGVAEDAGSRALLGLADAVRVPRGFWDYSGPGRLIAASVGASGARTQLTERGVLQTTLLGRAAALTPEEWIGRRRPASSSCATD